MGERARRATARFTDQSHVVRLLHAYERVLAATGRRRAREIGAVRARGRGPGGGAGRGSAGAGPSRAPRPRHADRADPPTFPIFPGRLALASSRLGAHVRILFANHTADWSGAEVALMRLVDGLRASTSCRRMSSRRSPCRCRRRGHDPATPAPAGEQACGCTRSRRRWLRRSSPRADSRWPGQPGGSAPTSSTPTRMRAGLMAAVARRSRRAPLRGRAPMTASCSHPSAGRCGRCRAQRASEIVAVSDYTRTGSTTASSAR